MIRPIPFALLSLSLAAPACQSGGAAHAEEQAAPVSDAQVAREPRPAREFSNLSRAGKYLVSWQAVDGPIPLNETFELDLHLRRADGDEPVAGAEVWVDAAMPEHNHGMLRQPQAHEVEPGVYRVEGMLLHMEGYWQVFVNVIENGVAETADFELTLE